MSGLSDQRPLPRVFSTVEVYSLGLGQVLFWLFASVAAYAALGAATLLVWVPIALIGGLTNFQNRHLARLWPEVVGGTPGYVRRLFPEVPALGRYATMAYFLGWAGIPPAAGLLAAAKLSQSLAQVGLSIPSEVLAVGMTIAPFVVATAGSRTLTTLHVIYIVPVLGLLVAFIAAGLAWLGLGAGGPVAPAASPPLSLPTFAFWWFVLSFFVYGMEAANVLMGESRRPRAVLRALAVTGVVNPLIMLSALVVLLVGLQGQAFDAADLQGTIGLAVDRIVGAGSGFFTAFFVLGALLTVSLSALIIAPRVLYQAARDGRAAEVFVAATPRGVFGPGLAATFVVAVLLALSGAFIDVATIAGVSWLLFWALLHLGSWHQRRSSAAWHPWPLLVLGCAEVIVLAIALTQIPPHVGILGLLLPAGLVLADAMVGRARSGRLTAAWWRLHYAPRQVKAGSFAAQLIATMSLVVVFAVLAWALGSHVGALREGGAIAHAETEIFAAMLLVVGFVGIAVAGRTTLARLAAVEESRVQAEEAADLRVEQAALHRANVELEEVARAQREFVSVVAHEFRTPLTGIVGFSEMIRDDDGLTSDETRDFANAINEDGQRLGRMITTMLDLDRLRSGKTTLSLESLDLNELIRSVATRVTLAAPRHRLVLELERSVPRMVGDRDKLTQVMTNLVSNAVKYSPGGSDVRIVSGSENGTLHVSVEDHGLGIPASDLERVFEPYTRVESHATEDVQGTGLGLPIASEIVKLHGGRMWVDSVEGQGSQFHLTLARSGPPGTQVP